MIVYKTISNFRPGLIESLLKTSYKRLIDFFPNEKGKFYHKWEKEDGEAFNNPVTIGEYILFSCLDNNPIGFFSWDERKYPLGIIGQNCILPYYQGQGFGRNQIESVVKIFQDKKFHDLRVVTGEHDFFIAAQKMYINCGFKEQRKMKGDLFNLIEFSKQI
jgi:GNAT superfamily N-acetyltransferase